MALARRTSFGGNKPKLRNCAQCGRIFSPTRGENLCRDCRMKEEEMERQVMIYVRDHQGISIKEAVEATGVSEKIVKRMAREGMFVKNGLTTANFLYPCTGCGRPISTGTYCSDCLARLRVETKKAAEAMHIRVKDDKRMSTIDRLNAAAQREFERENKVIERHFSQGMTDLINKMKNKS